MTQSPAEFTVESANALIPKIEAILEELQKKKEEYNKLHDHYFLNELLNEASSQESQTQSESRQGLDKEAQVLDHSIHSLQEKLQQLRALGCVVRSVEPAVIEFLSTLDHKPIYLRWQFGDKEIQHYRYLDDNQDVKHLLIEKK